MKKHHFITHNNILGYKSGLDISGKYNNIFVYDGASTATEINSINVMGFRGCNLDDHIYDEKIKELTLYIIEQEDKIEVLETQWK